MLFHAEVVSFHADSTTGAGSRSRRSFNTLAILLPLACLLAGPAAALEGIDLSAKADVEDAAEEVAPGGCSQLVQIKYPFLSCSNGEIGLAGGNDTWETARQIPRQSVFIEGTGYWGPDQNQN